jgi:hypothetical protein
LLPAFFLLSPRLFAADWAAPLTNRAPRAEVVVVSHPAATEAFQPRPGIIREMVARGVTKLTGQTNPAAAWRQIAGTNETLGLKVHAAAGRNSGTRVEVVAAVIEGLLEAGTPPERIVVWDRREKDLRAGGFADLAARYGVRVRGALEAGWDATVFYDTALLGNLMFGDLEFGQTPEGTSRKSHLSKLLTQDITRHISIAPALNHNEAGVAGHLWSLALGGADNVWRFESKPERLATAVPELFALPEIADRTALFITDALICQYQGGQRDLLHYAVVANELRFSRDPVASDVLTLRQIADARAQAEARPARPFDDELYRNAALLELGVADPKRIAVTTVKLAGTPRQRRRGNRARRAAPGGR